MAGAGSIPTVDASGQITITAIERRDLPVATGFQKRALELQGKPLTRMVAETAVELDTDCKRFIDAAEKQRTEMKRPVLEAGRRIDDFFKRLMAPAISGRQIAGQLAAKYQIEQRRKAEVERLERERLALEQAEAERQAQADALAEEAAATGDESLLAEAIRVEQAPITPTLVPAVEAAKLDGVSVRMVKIGMVTSPFLLLRYLIGGNDHADPAQQFARIDLITEILGDPATWKVNAPIRRGLTLPGVEVHEEPAVTNRMR